MRGLLHCQKYANEISTKTEGFEGFRLQPFSTKTAFL